MSIEPALLATKRFFKSILNSSHDGCGKQERRSSEIDDAPNLVIFKPGIISYFLSTASIFSLIVILTPSIPKRTLSFFHYQSFTSILGSFCFYQHSWCFWLGHSYYFLLTKLS